MAEKFKSSKKAHIIIISVMFLILLMFNIFTEMIADDFSYSFSFATGERIDDLGDIKDSLIAHGEKINGRYFSHLIVHIFLLLPPIVFDIVNSAVFVAIIYIAYRMCNVRRETDNIMLVGIFGLTWLFEHDFGQVNLWLDGSINYQFALLFGLAFIIPYVNSFMRGKNLNPLLILPHIIISFWFGGYIEPVAVGFVCSAFIFVLLDVVYNKRKRALLFIPSLISSLLGFAVIALTPSHLDKKLSTFSLLELLKMFGMAMLVVLSISPLIVAYIILVKRAKAEGVDNRIILTAHALGTGALASNFILVIASYFALRCTISFVFMSIMATALLYGSIKNRNFGKKGRICEQIFAITLSLAIVVGFVDTVITYSVIKENEKTVAAAISEGKSEVELKAPFPFTKYNAAWLLAYLEDGDGRAWPNTDMAKYYGIDIIKRK